MTQATYNKCTTTVEHVREIHAHILKINSLILDSKKNSPVLLEDVLLLKSITNKDPNPHDTLFEDFNKSFTSALIPEDIIASLDESERLALLCETLTDRLSDAKLTKSSAETFFEKMHES